MKSFKLLGVFFDEHLSFNKKISHIAAKLSRANFLLRRVNNFVSYCSELCEVIVVMSSYKGAQLIWGNPGGSGNWNGEEMGSEWGGQFTSNLDQGGQGSHHAKRRDSK
jgi:hypothetical protein